MKSESLITERGLQGGREGVLSRADAGDRVVLCVHNKEGAMALVTLVEVPHLSIEVEATAIRAWRKPHGRRRSRPLGPERARRWQSSSDGDRAIGLAFSAAECRAIQTRYPNGRNPLRGFEPVDRKREGARNGRRGEGRPLPDEAQDHGFVLCGEPLNAPGRRTPNAYAPVGHRPRRARGRGRVRGRDGDPVSVRPDVVHRGMRDRRPALRRWSVSAATPLPAGEAGRVVM
jgi:hypothetical protein